MISVKFVGHYDEIEKLIPGQIDELQDLLNNAYGLKVTDKYRPLMERCLRQKDGDVNGAAKLLKGFHIAACNLVSWEASFRPSFYQDYYGRGVVQLMKNRDDLGRRVFIIRAGLWDPKKENFDSCIAGTWMAYVYASVLYPDVQRNGFVTVWDFAGFTLQHFLAVKQWKLLAFLRWAQTGIIGRMKEFHGINQPKLVAVLYALVRPLIKEKLRKRIHFHSNVDDIINILGRQNWAGILKSMDDTNKWTDSDFSRELLASDKYFADMLLNKLPPK